MVCFPNRFLLSLAAAREPTMQVGSTIQVGSSCFLCTAIRLFSHPGDVCSKITAELMYLVIVNTYKQHTPFFVIVAIERTLRNNARVCALMSET